MAKRRRHWMDEISEAIRDRISVASEAVAQTMEAEVPLGYKPPAERRPTVDDFLQMDPTQRQAIYTDLGPEKYQEFTTAMMTKLAERFGPAAQVLFPMLSGAPVEALAAQQNPQGQEALLGASLGDTALSDLVGIDLFGGR